MRFFKSFRLLHRRTKSEGDVIAVLAAQSAAQTACGSFSAQRASFQCLPATTFGSNFPLVDAVNFTPPDSSLPFFNPIDLYASFPYTAPAHLLAYSVETNTAELEAELATLREANRTLDAELVEITKEAKDARTAFYAEMTKNAYLKRQAMVDAERIQTFIFSFTRYRAIDGLLASVGLHKAVLEEALATLNDGGNPEDVIMDVINRARTNGRGTAIIGSRTPEQYGAILDMTLKVRKELKGHKKITKFWKQAAQQDGKHKETITPSPSDISSINEKLSPDRQKAVDDLAARRREIATHSLATCDSISFVKSITLPASQEVTSSSTVYSDGLSNLPPLVSESIKREMAHCSTNKRTSANRPVKKDPELSILRQVDLNVSKTSTILESPSQAQISQRRPTAPASPTRHRHPSTTSGISSGRINKRRHRSDVAYSSRSFVSASLCKSDSSSSRFPKAGGNTSGQRSPLRRHSSVTECNLPSNKTAFQTCASDNSHEVAPIKSFQHGTSLEYIGEESPITHDQDTSFATYATPTTGPTTPSKTPELSKTPNSSPTKKSKLPVLKYLRRLSPLLSPTDTIMNTTPSNVMKLRTRSSSSPAPPRQRSAIPISNRRPTVTGGQNFIRK